MAATKKASKSLDTTTSSTQAGDIDVKNARFPFCITWTPIPLITWLLPFIGHTGIGNSAGIIHDFAGPYTICIDDFSFGETNKYVPLAIDDKAQFDDAVERADA